MICENELHESTYSVCVTTVSPKENKSQSYFTGFGSKQYTELSIRYLAAILLQGPLL